MSKDKNCEDGTNCPTNLVTKEFCDERFERVVEKLDTIDEKVTELKADKKDSSHAYRNMILTIVSGAVVAGVACLLSMLR